MRQGHPRGLARASVLAAILGAVALAGCADTPTSADHPPIPSLAVHPLTGAQCAEWSCSIDDCTNDPGQYGACCVQAVDAQHPNEQPRPSCGGTLYDGGSGECGPDTPSSQEIYAAGCACPAWAACCYYTNPSSVDPGTCNDPGGPY